LAFHITHNHGTSESDPLLESLDTLYDELDQSDTEHPDVSLTHESGWCLAAFQSGLLIWENVEDGDPQHMRRVDREQTLRLWRLLANGNIDEIDQENWQDGYG
jgi:hypothetical protein